MKNCCLIILIYGLCLLDLIRARQAYNQNTDFLLHEGGLPNGPKRNIVQSTTSGTSTPRPQTANQGTGNRDYVAQFPQLRPVSTPQSSNNLNINAGSTTRHPQTTSAKRDYVAPKFTTTRPTQHTNQPSTGKVKDLVHFYDGKGKGQSVPQGAPSYSSVLQGSSNNMASSGTTSSVKITQTTPKPTSSTITTKPLSFSAVVAGAGKGSTQGHSTVTTPKPTTRLPLNTSSSRPGSTILPSSIVNNNKNTNQGTNSNGPSDAELQTLSEELLRKDVNNANKYVTINYQEKTTSWSQEDKAPLPLLTISPEVWNIPTIQKLVPLLDNYERDTLVNEYITPQERNEENAFMDAIMSTTVIRHLMNFLKDKGYVTPDPRQQRDFLKQLWFSLYSRGQGKISSSGFEHVFVSELKKGAVSGLHNWIYFSREESAGRANYLGYMKYSQLADKGVVMKLHFTQLGVDKPVDSMFIGTSPELEMALYTLCFVTRADNDCKLKLGNNDININTNTFRYRSKNLIGSAYPQI